MVAEDTDIILLRLAVHRDTNYCVYVKCGTATRTRYMSEVSAALDHDVWASLLGLHSFTGCDTFSAFSGCRKLVALKLLMTHDHL